jgi:hypothetical protein
MDSVLAWGILTFLVLRGIVKLFIKILEEEEARKYYNEENSYNW